MHNPQILQIVYFFGYVVAMPQSIAPNINQFPIMQSNYSVVQTPSPSNMTNQNQYMNSSYIPNNQSRTLSPLMNSSQQVPQQLNNSMYSRIQGGNVVDPNYNTINPNNMNNYVNMRTPPFNMDNLQIMFMCIIYTYLLVYNNFMNQFSNNNGMGMTNPVMGGTQMNNFPNTYNNSGMMPNNQNQPLPSNNRMKKI